MCVYEGCHDNKAVNDFLFVFRKNFMQVMGQNPSKWFLPVGKP